ncbi:MAG: glycosyltransferase family A protein [Candidatus Hodarchaeota archaeon]
MSEKEAFEILFDNDFVDRYETDQAKAVDVIIPLINTNPMFEKSLINFYKRIPINRLIIGDSGCTDDSIEIVKKFPRVIVFDHTSFKSLGYRIKLLIESCETEFFIYLHADVFLPENWFDIMYSRRLEHNWYECGRKNISVVLWDSKAQELAERAYSGSQFGNTGKLKEAVSAVEDDYLYRNEDIVISELMNKDNYMKYSDTYHYHQFQRRKGEEEPSLIVTAKVSRAKDVQWEIDAFEMQWRGIVKYCEPKPYLRENVKGAIRVLILNNAFNAKEAKKWIQETNPKWNPYLWKRTRPNLWARKIYVKLRQRMRRILRK